MNRAGEIAFEKLSKLHDEDSDFEEDHEEADDVLCELLEEIGYKYVVDEYRKVGKWYA